MKSKNKTNFINVTEFNLTSRSELKKLVNMTRLIKIIEKTFFVLDIGIRLAKVYQDYKNGKNVGRSFLKNTVGFLASTYLVSSIFSSLGSSGAAMSGGLILSGPLLVLALVVGAIALFYFSNGVTEKAEDIAVQAYDMALKIFNSFFGIGN